MRGFFGIGVEGISKEANVGSIVRSAHAFGASFFYTITPDVDVHRVQKTDTSGAFDHVPYFQYDSLDEFALPKGCQLVAVELTDDAVELPSFRHPTRAAYVLGAEMSSVSPELMARCDHVIKIPMKFCVNVGVAAALVMYDRTLTMGRFAPRPVRVGGPTEMVPVKPRGGHRRISRTKDIDTSK